MSSKVINNQRGAVAAEYSLLAVLIAGAVVSVVAALGTSVLGLFAPIADFFAGLVL